MTVAGTTIGFLIPDQLVGNIQTSLIYFLNQINNIEFLVNTNTLFNVIRIFGNFILLVSYYEIILWIGAMFV